MNTKTTLKRAENEELDVSTFENLDQEPLYKNFILCLQIFRAKLAFNKKENNNKQYLSGPILILFPSDRLQ